MQYLQPYTISVEIYLKEPKHKMHIEDSLITNT